MQFEPPYFGYIFETSEKYAGPYRLETEEGLKIFKKLMKEKDVFYTISCTYKEENKSLLQLTIEK